MRSAAGKFDWHQLPQVVNRQEDESTPDSEPPDEPTPEQPDETDTEIEDSADESGEESDPAEWEPLTPELVQEEAERGDFMLRWAVILLACLMGCTLIAETQTLVHIKTGQYLATHGFLPPAHDVFSSTATDLPWLNHAWLFDLLISGVYSVAGPIGLSLIKAVIAAAVFYLILHLSLKGVSTWWGSIVATLALLCCFPHFAMQPNLLTLLGIVLVLQRLLHWSRRETDRTIWWLVPLFVVWSNVDPRVFWGLGLVWLFAAGLSFDEWRGREVVVNRQGTGQLWQVAAASLLASFCNPFGWNVLTSPFRLYGIEYPLLRLHPSGVPLLNYLQYLPIGSAVFWHSLTAYSVAGLLVILTALVSLVLNRQRAACSHWLLVLASIALASFGGHELAAAAVVCAVIGTWNAQEWYQNTFRQEYRVERGELAFSRGGRAITVLGFFAVALLTVNGRLVSIDHRSLGLGFDRTLSNSIADYEQLTAETYDDNVFNYVLPQGDLLIWVGKRPFIDSRIQVYVTNEENAPARQHDAARRSLRESSPDLPGSGQPEVWQAIFKEHGISQLMPRLSQPRPDYRSFFQLWRAPEMQLMEVGGVSALFCWDRKDAPELQQYISQHRFDAIDEVFHNTRQDAAVRGEWARPISVYRKYLYAGRRRETFASQQARHFLQMLTVMPDSPASGVEWALLAVHAAGRALAEDAQQAEAYRTLGNAYDILERLEGQLGGAGTTEAVLQMRFYQAIAAYHQALIIDPNLAGVHENLLQLYYRHRKFDLALEALEESERLLKASAENRQAIQPVIERNERLREQLVGIVEPNRTRVSDILARGGNRLQAAQAAFAGGCVDTAIEVLQGDPVFLSQNPFATLFLANLMLEAGRSEEAFRLTQEVQPLTSRFPQLRWRQFAALMSAVKGDQRQAAAMRLEELQELNKQRFQQLFSSLPFAMVPPQALALQRNLWPVTQTVSAFDSLYRREEEITAQRFDLVRCALESGKPRDALLQLDAILEGNPNTRLRPLVRFYYYQLTGKLIDPEPPGDWIPLEEPPFEKE